MAFYLCKECGNLAGMLNYSGAEMICCGQPMVELKPNTVDAAKEKHVPKVTVDGGLVTVEVGEVAHPMTEAHYIAWIYIETEKGGQRKNLKPGEAPKAVFALKDDKIIAAYAYCNLHGLWKKDI